MTQAATTAVQYPPLVDAVAELRSVADEVDQGRRALHRSFGDFLGVGWTGRAADSFGAGWDEWSSGVADVVDALRCLADLVQAHGHRVAAVDAGAGDGVARLGRCLGRTGAP